MENPSTGPSRRKSIRSGSTPYSRPDSNRRKSLLHKVSSSLLVSLLGVRQDYFIKFFFNE